jgi:hypothetical protein
MSLRAIRSLGSWQHAFLDDFIMFCCFELELDASSDRTRTLRAKPPAIYRIAATAGLSWICSRGSFSILLARDA